MDSSRPELASQLGVLAVAGLAGITGFDRALQPRGVSGRQQGIVGASRNRNPATSAPSYRGGLFVFTARLDER